MKTIKKFLYLLVIPSLFIFSFSSCEESENEEGPVIETDEIEDDELITSYYEDVLADVEMAENAFENNNPLKSASVDEVICRSVEHEYVGDTLIITITYNGECQFEIDGELHYRSGKIITKRFGGRKFERGATKIVTLEDFEIDSVQIEGTHKVVSQGLNDDSTSVLYDVTLRNGKVTLPTGDFATRETDKTRLHTIGKNWFDRRDDELLINGNSTGMNFRGLAYTKTYTDVLKVPGCPVFLSGTIMLEIEGMPTTLVDYGDGNCDRKVVITRDGQSREITLRFPDDRRHRLRRN
ncbi:MAG: hypothetical protein GVY19_06325 [Bacteroidetes bacterium]|jgi:hypothetical protein|nr:hypothetical protein [Bacteroidota bacterium]